MLVLKKDILRSFSRGYIGPSANLTTDYSIEVPSRPRQSRETENYSHRSAVVRNQKWLCWPGQHQFTLPYHTYLHTYLPICLSRTYGSTALCWTLAFFSVSLSFIQSIELLGRGSARRKAHRTAQTQNKRTKTSMPQVGLEPWLQCLSRRRQFMP
jgi:hypothetical protein